MVSITAAVREDELDPAGRYVVTRYWGGKLTLGPGDPEFEMRTVRTAEDYAEATGDDWVLDLDPGQLYDRTMDITFGVAEWAAMRARNAEAERQAATLAKVRENQDMPRDKYAVDAVAVTGDGARHLFTVAWRDEQRVVNDVARWRYMRLEIPSLAKNDPPWLADAYRAWSPESVRLAEARHAGEISAEDADAIGEAFTRPWWAAHRDNWTAWAERAARDRRKRTPGDYTAFPTVIKRSKRGAF